MDWHNADIVHKEEWGQQPAEEEERSCSTRENKEDGQVEAKADGEWTGLVKDGDWHVRMAYPRGSRRSHGGTRKNKEDGDVEAKADGEWNGHGGGWHGRGEGWKEAKRRIPGQPDMNLTDQFKAKVRIPKDGERRGHRQAREEAEACLDSQEVTKGRATGRSVPAGKSDEPGRGYPTVAEQASSAATAGIMKQAAPTCCLGSRHLGRAMDGISWMAYSCRQEAASSTIRAESLTGKRVTKLFQKGKLVSIHVDDWRKLSSSRFDGVHVQWKGYTFFEIGSPATDDDDGFQLVSE
eukprot:symbB.v1.2.023959.t1/scaffold2234.1/size87202/3